MKNSNRQNLNLTGWAGYAGYLRTYPAYPAHPVKNYFRFRKSSQKICAIAIKDLNQVMHDGDPSYYRIPDDQELISQLLFLYEMSAGTEHEHWVDYAYTTLRMRVEITDFDAEEIETLPGCAIWHGGGNCAIFCGPGLCGQRPNLLVSDRPLCDWSLNDAGVSEYHGRLNRHDSQPGARSRYWGRDGVRRNAA